MARQTTSGVGTTTRSVAFERFAGVAGMTTGVCSLLYAVFFLLVSGPPHTSLPPLFLAIGGFLAFPVVTAVYARVRDADPTFALWALLLAAFGYLGTAVHAVYGLALLIPTQIKDNNAALFPGDPRGFVAFGIPGAAILIFAWLIVRSGQFARGLGYMGYVLGVSVILLFLGTLLTNDLKSLLVLVPGAVASLIATPVWNIGLGLALLRGN